MVRMGAARSGKSLDNLKAEQSKFDVWMDDLRERENSRMPARMPQWSAFATGGSCHLLSSPWLKGLYIINLRCILDFQLQTLCR